MALALLWPLLRALRIRNFGTTWDCGGTGAAGGGWRRGSLLAFVTLLALLGRHPDFCACLPAARALAYGKLAWLPVTAADRGRARGNSLSRRLAGSGPQDRDRRLCDGRRGSSLRGGAFREAGGRARPAAIHWWSGLALLPEAFSQFHEPALLLGGFTTLLLAGLILGYARDRTQSLWMPIGLHAGWILGKMGLLDVALALRGMAVARPGYPGRPGAAFDAAGNVGNRLADAEGSAMKTAASGRGRCFRSSIRPAARAAARGSASRAICARAARRARCASRRPFARSARSLSAGDQRRLHLRNCAGRNFHFTHARRAYRSEGIVRDFIHRFKYWREFQLRHPLAAGRPRARGRAHPQREGRTRWCPCRSSSRASGTASSTRRRSWRGWWKKAPASPCCDCLLRTRNTSSQLTHDRQGRMENLRNAFRDEAQYRSAWPPSCARGRCADNRVNPG